MVLNNCKLLLQKYKTNNGKWINYLIHNFFLLQSIIVLCSKPGMSQTYVFYTFGRTILKENGLDKILLYFKIKIQSIASTDIE